MLTIPTKFVIDSARKLNLSFWQVTEGGNEIARQDEEISLDDSLAILEDTLNELKENARSGDKVKVSMQSQQMTSAGRKKGMQLRTFYVYLKEPEQARNSQGISNLSLLEENIRLKMQMEHENKEREFIKRIEALENQEEEKSGFDKFIEGLDKLTTNPAAQMLLGMMLNGKPTQPQAPVINGVPEQDYSELLERIEKIDPEFITMLAAIVRAAESDSDTYFMYKKQLTRK